jgi:hypothetical protein
VRKKLIIYYLFSFFFLCNTVVFGYSEKDISEGTRSVAQLLKQSEILGADLKGACINHPEFLYEIADWLINVSQFVQLRPDPELIDEVFAHVKSNKRSLFDFYVLYFTFVSYGEIFIHDGKLGMRSDEYFNPYDVSYPLFKPYLLIMNEIIRKLGKKVSWDEDKIRREMENFNLKIGSFFLNLPHECTIYSSAFFEKDFADYKNQLEKKNVQVEQLKQKSEQLEKVLVRRKEKVNLVKKKCLELDNQ